MNSNDHIQRFRRFQQSREKHFAPLINEALHHQYKIAAAYSHLGAHAAVLKIDSGGIQRVIRNLYMDAGIIYGAKIRADLNKQGLYKKSLEQKKLAIGFSERMAQLIADYFRTDILNTSEGITQTTRELILQVFTTYYEQGYGIDDIVKQLANTELSKVRARLIARTETVSAANAGALFVAKDTGLKLNKTWLAAHDKRTRLTHSDHGGVDGHTVGMDDYFVVGGETMLIPGARVQENGLPVDPSLYINCRCTCTFAGMRDANGRLIRA